MTVEDPRSRTVLELAMDAAAVDRLQQAATMTTGVSATVMCADGTPFEVRRWTAEYRDHVPLMPGGLMQPPPDYVRSQREQAARRTLEAGGAVVQLVFEPPYRERAISFYSNLGSLGLRWD